MKRLAAPHLALAATFAIGLVLLGAADMALAGTVSRDHRGPNGAPSGGVTVDGQKPRSPRRRNWAADDRMAAIDRTAISKASKAIKATAPLCAIIAPKALSHRIK